MRHWTAKALTALPLSLLLSAALADDQPLTPAELATKLNGIEASDISKSPVAGLYQVAVGRERRVRHERRQVHLSRRHLRRRFQREYHRRDTLARPRVDARKRRPEEHDRVQAEGR